MAETRKNLSRHLRSAREWLTNAEEAFDNKSDVKGELNLLLAQAELQHVRENRRPKFWQPGHPLLRHGLAFSAAVFVATLGLGGAYWLSHQPEQFSPQPLPRQEIAAGAVLSGATFQAPAQPVRPAVTEEARPSEKAVAVSPAAVNAVMTVSQPVPIVQETQPADSQLPPGEMHKLIRAAAKSLRGQE